MKNTIKITIVADATDSITQAREVAVKLSPEGNIEKIYKDEEVTFSSDSSIPDLAIGVGFNVADQLLNIKKLSKGKTRIASILDPLKNYEDFDFIFLPSYEPYKVTGKNIFRTKGLVSFVNDLYLDSKIYDYKNHPKYEFLRRLDLENKRPILSVVIGGKHTGGNISEDDAKEIAKNINQIVSKNNGYALITTSNRTEVNVPRALRDELKVPYFLYDYKSRNTENIYGVMLALADEIIVTGESVRMMSECCSTGKRVRIFKPSIYGFQYDALIDEFIKGNYAMEIDGESNNFEANKLDEAARIADIIRKKLNS